MATKTATTGPIIPLLLLALLCQLACSGDSGRNSAGGRKTRGGSNADGATNQGFAAAAALGSGTIGLDDLKGMTIEDLAHLESKRRSQDANDQDALERLVVVNFELCKALRKIRQSCPAIKRIIPESAEQNLQCKYSSEATQLTEVPLPTTSKIEVTIKGSGKFKLIANDTYESSEFSGGSPTVISFHAKGADNVMAPRFLDLYRLVLRSATDGAAIPGLMGAEIKITIDGTLLFNDFAQASFDTKRRAENSEYNLDLTSLTKTAQTSNCKMSERKFNDLVNVSEEPIKNKQVSSRTNDYFKNKDSNISATKVADTESNRNTLSEKILKLQASISTRSPVLEAELSKKMTLRSALLTDSKRGCHFNKKIEKFSVQIQGSRRNDYVGTQRSRQPPEQGDGASTELAFDFGTLSFTVDLLEDNIINVPYYYTNLEETDVIGGIDRINIRKKGVSYNSLRECTSKLPTPSFSLGIDFDMERCEFSITEENVISISEIIVSANDNVIYHGRDLSITFNRNKSRYVVDQFYSNPQWIELMQQTDCDTQN